MHHQHHGPWATPATTVSNVENDQSLLRDAQLGLGSAIAQLPVVLPYATQRVDCEPARNMRALVPCCERHKDLDRIACSPDVGAAAPGCALGYEQVAATERHAHDCLECCPAEQVVTQLG